MHKKPKPVHADSRFRNVFRAMESTFQMGAAKDWAAVPDAVGNLSWRVGLVFMNHLGLSDAGPDSARNRPTSNFLVGLKKILLQLLAVIKSNPQAGLLMSRVLFQLAQTEVSRPMVRRNHKGFLYLRHKTGSTHLHLKTWGSLLRLHYCSTIQSEP